MVCRLVHDRLWAETAAGRGRLRVRVGGRLSAPRAAPAMDRRSAPDRRDQSAAAPETPDTLERLAAEIRCCTRCALSRGRIQAVPGEGPEHPAVMFVGEAPGMQEDRQGRPFVGPAGQLLNRMIAAMGLSREAVFIANVLKCRPPGNRDPLPEEVAACKDFLRRQLAVLNPRVIVPLGAHAARWFLNTSVGIMAVRGRRVEIDGRVIVPTLHPSYLLHRPEDKRKAWEDLQVVMGILGLPRP